MSETQQGEGLAQQLQAALTPAKPGMKRIPFPLSTFTHPSKPLSDKRLVNYFAETAQADARTVVALVPTAGLTQFFTIGAGPILAMNADAAAAVFVVSGTHFWRLTGSPTAVVAEDLGSVGAVPGDPYFVSIAAGVNDVVVCVPPNAYTTKHAFGSPLQPIGGGGWPAGGASSVAHIDGYFVFTEFIGSPKFFTCELMDPLTYDPQDYAYADAVPNVLRRVVTHRGQLWVMGARAIEIWYNSGDQNFPFRRQPGGVIHGGIASGQSVAQIDNSIWWCANDTSIYRSRGYEALRVSDFALERFIRTWGPMQAARAFGHGEVGHAMYAFTIGNRTFVYDTVTQAWHERSSYADGAGQWRPSCACHWGGYYLMGDSVSGKVFEPTPQAFLDDGVAPRRQVNFPPLYAGTNRAFCARVEVELEVGTAASGNLPIELTWSDDGGQTFTAPPRVMQTGALGATRTRVFTTRLGSFRQREFSIGTWGSATLYAVSADIQKGVS